METSNNGSAKSFQILYLIFVLFLCFQWICFSCVSGLSFVLITILSGVAIFGAAFMLSWAAEISQFDIPQTLALSLVALLAVLPEYAVDMYFAWVAGKKPEYIQYATANMTGANRLLIGLGWAVVLAAFCAKKKGIFKIALESTNRIEILALFLATAYSFFIPLKGGLSLIDSLVLLSIFGIYMNMAIRAHVVEPELEGGPAELLSNLPKWYRRFSAFALFAVAGFTIFIAAEPFAEGLLKTGEHFGIEQFLLVQWLAPLASESPEFIVAIIFALKLKPNAGLSTLVSSKVNQWTLLIGMLPIAYCLSSGSIQTMLFDARQTEEVLLTAAQSLFALVLIMSLDFNWWKALLLFVLFITQAFFPSMTIRYIYSGVYIGLSIIIFMFDKEVYGNFPKMIRLVWQFKPKNE